MINFQNKPLQAAIKRTLQTTVGATMIAASSYTANAALSSNAILTLDTGAAVQVCAHDTNGTGGSCYSLEWQNNPSYFNMSGIGNTHLTNREGILIGVAQPASGSHSLTPTGDEAPSIDEAWGFFENTGMHFTPAGSSGITIIDNTGANGNAGNEVDLDFSNWSVTWNGIARINMGGDPANFDPSVNTGVGTMICAATCGNTDTFTITYRATVPDQDPSNFGGVSYTLYLAGSISQPVPPSSDANVPAAGTIAAAEGTNADDVTKLTGAELVAGGVPADSDYNNVGGYYDFVVTGMGVGGTVNVVLTLDSALPADAVYRKYISGAWTTLPSTGANKASSAATVAGSCLAAGNAAYNHTNGLVGGDQCIQLTLVDGGIYDASGAGDTVADPGGPGVGAGVFVDTRTSGTSGCSVSRSPINSVERADWWLVGGFLAWMGTLFLRRRKKLI